MPKHWHWYVLILGAFLTLRGYQSREVDQAYRLPLLLHAQNPALFADDPFVRAFDAFNPHRGYLVVLNAMSRCTGLSLGLLLLYLCTFAATARGVDRLARGITPDDHGSAGLVAFVMVLVARAGNIGTNHLFDGELLDRLVGLSLGWLAIAAAVRDPRKGTKPAVCVGLAGLIHPSIGLQLAMLLGSSWVVWPILERQFRVLDRCLLANLAILALALVPSVLLVTLQRESLLDGLPASEFWHLSVEIQGPQHMLPHLWRLPQWLAWGCYFVLAALALRPLSGNLNKARLATSLGILLVGLGVATIGIESFRNLRLTLFQPFRMATFARGLALVLASGRIRMLWNRGDLGGKVRAGLQVTGLAGDWMMVITTSTELAATFGEWLGRRVVQKGGLLHRENRPSGPHVTPGNPFADNSNVSWRDERVDRGQPLSGLFLREEMLPNAPRRFMQNTEKPEIAPHRTMTTVATHRSIRSKAVVRETETCVDSWAAAQSVRWANIIGLCVWCVGLVYLRRHDTQQGQWPLLATAGAVMLWALLNRRLRLQWNARRRLLAFSFAWSVPLAAFVVPPLLGVESGNPVVETLAGRCRFWAVPLDDVEKLAVWAREQSPTNAVFMGPPGPKAFRLWSMRSLVFNRAASPYHATGLSAWADRFKAHVSFVGSNQEFAAAYLKNRQALESRFEQRSNREIVDLASRYGAEFVLTASKREAGDGLNRLKTQGRYSIFRVANP